ncbi:MAG: hypothetical protein LUC37_04490 [Prevotella sp.]|nr:hypothetical protein [Prevotella sp.]
MKRLVLYITSILLLFSCGNMEYEYSSEKCYFIFDNTASRSIYLSQAMTPYSGVFCRIYVQGEYFKFETNTSSEAETIAMTAVDKSRTIDLGVYNSSGIIVGYGNLDYPATFYAYDYQCPNCYKVDELPQFPLTMDTSGKAKCKKCSREYDMNNGGIVSSGEGGDKLMRYRASTTGTFGVLSVVN